MAKVNTNDFLWNTVKHKEIFATLKNKKKIHILIYNIPHLEWVLFQSDIHGYAWNFIIMKDLFNGYEIQIQNFHALKRIESSNMETVLMKKKKK